MNKTVGLKAKNTSSKGKINGVAKTPMLAHLLATKRTAEQEADFKAYLQEFLGEDNDSILYEDIEKNRDEIIERNKLTWEHIKAIQNEWREIHGPYHENLKNDLVK
jgi:hypothetical protein